MISLLHNRRKYTAGQVIPSGGGVWADFDLSKLGVPEHSVQLFDNAAGSQATKPLRCYNLLALDDGALLVNAQYQGHAYIFDFPDNASFDLSQIILPRRSRSVYASSFYCIFPFPDGSGYYRSVNSSTPAISFLPLNPAYSLADSGTAVTVFSGSTAGINLQPYCFFFAPDGKSFFYKSYDNSTSSYANNLFFHVSRSGAWPKSSAGYTTLQGFHLQNLFGSNFGSGTNNWECFTFSPDGKVALFTTLDSVVKIVLSTPWDFSSASFHSYKTFSYLPVDGTNRSVSLGGVAVNNDGTRMILHNRGTSDAYAAFYDFALSA